MASLPALRRTLPGSIVKGLRFRLTFTYVLLFSVLLAALGLFFRQMVRAEMDNETRGALDAEYALAKSYLNIENGKPIWLADSTDPEEAYILERLRHVYLLADPSGKILEVSETYRATGIDSAREIQRVLAQGQPEVQMRRSLDGIPYLIRAGSLRANSGQLYYFAMGRSLDANIRTADAIMRRYFLLVLGVIAVASLLGWFMAGRAIQPLNSVAGAAHMISGSNFKLRIPNRGAGDELDHLIDTFNHMTERLGHSFEQIRQFSTDVSHELRTPLTAIRGQLEVALLTADSPAQYREAMTNALEDVERLSSIVRALLLLSQAESGQLVLQKAPLDLSGVARDIAEQFEIPAEEKRLRIVTDLSSAPVIADRTQMERLLSNLLSNAVKYTPVGGQIAIRIGPDAASPSIRLVVEDTGAGIPAANLPHIFDRFYRVRNPVVNQIHGLGLGLSFVHWIVSTHDGKITVESELGKGTRFTVLLPAAAGLLVREPGEMASAATVARS